MESIIFIVESAIFVLFIVAIVFQIKKTIKSYKEWKNGKVKNNEN